jgi:hypothetical protein
MDPSSPQHPNSSPLLEHLETLYPLACILVGPEKASPLLRRMAEDATEAPALPTDVEGWLQLLLRTAQNDHTLSETTPRSSLTNEKEPTDAWRHDAAEQLLETTLPIALARCTPQERFLLALDGLDAVSPSFQTRALSDAVDTTRTEGWEKLRATLKDILSDTEYELIDETLSEGTFQEAVEELLATRYPTVPRSLRSQLQETLQNDSSLKEDGSPSENAESLLERLPPRPKPQTLLFTLLTGALILAGGIGAFYYTESASSSATSSRSLITFSAEQAGSITPTVETTSRSEAAAFVDSAWNRRLTVPGIDGAELKGVGQLRTTDDMRIPVFVHMDGDTRFTTFAYSYALLNQIKSTATLSPELRNALATAHRAVNTADKTPERALLWRDRDDIFVTVAPTLSPDSLRARLRLQG